VKRETSSRLYALEDLVTLGRKYGISLLFIAQNPETISQEVIDNAGTIFLMNGNPNKKLEIILPKDYARYISIMPRGEALVKMSTRQTLVHIKVKTPEHIKTVKESEKQTIWENKHIEEYTPIETPYEKFLLKLITKDYSIKNLKGE